MKTIFKYQLSVIERQIRPLPAGAEILSFQNQGEEPMIWALVDHDAQYQERTFVIVGTGRELQSAGGSLKYIGTAQFLGGAFVWHLFEEVN